ncbi:MAG TPA: aryl-sulfate sulfotransferase [Dehalococcoidia bacterium]|jgi:outer membrane protein assembly factor BamB|nr:aryl-sulfate sulfotransferase [Dehalococcoidia bacterium]
MGWSAFRKTGLTHHGAGALKGYTLLSPMTGSDTYLIDMSGQVVNRWRFEGFRLVYSRLLPNGNLLTLAGDESRPAPVMSPGQVPTFEEQVRMTGGVGTHLLESTWDGEVVWRYENPAIHHDFVRLPNGHTWLPEIVQLPDDIAKAVRGGVRGRPPRIISDDFIEIDATGKELRRIHLWQLLDPARDPICPLERRDSWTHTNSLDITRDGDLLFSCRHNSRVGIVDVKTGELTWKYGAPNVYHQHHATALTNGNVQVFDNGMHRNGMTFSSIVEVDPKTSEVAWRYTGSPEQQFFSGHISGAERLSEGHVLITEGTSGRIFEVTRKGEVVWEWISPFVTWRREQPLSWVFRAYRYALDDPALARRELDPGRFRELNRAYGLVE